MWLHLTEHSINLNHVWQVTTNGPKVVLHFIGPNVLPLTLEETDAEIAREMLRQTEPISPDCWLLASSDDDDHSPVL